MGLSERKIKQKIIADPRNLTWANDSNRFGTKYLASLGWSANEGQGLGRDLQGRVDPIKVKMKLGALGIGVEPKVGMADNGVSWKQNWDFEGVLKRLNNQDGDSTGDNEEESSGTKVVGFVRQAKKEDKDLKPQETDAALPNELPETSRGNTSPIASARPNPTAPPVKRAHRAKFRASKQLASSSGTATPSAIQEILGIAPSSSSLPATPLAEPSNTSLAPVDTSTEKSAKAPGEEDNLLTVSKTSLANYFASKMKAKGLNMNGTTSDARPNEDAISREGEPPHPDVDPSGVALVTLETDQDAESVPGKQKKKDKKDKSKKRKREDGDSISHEASVEVASVVEKPKKKKKKKINASLE